jgi:hypothetical protein
MHSCKRRSTRAHFAQEQRKWQDVLEADPIRFFQHIAPAAMKASREALAVLCHCDADDLALVSHSPCVSSCLPLRKRIRAFPTDVVGRERDFGREHGLAVAVVRCRRRDPHSRPLVAQPSPFVHPWPRRRVSRVAVARYNACKNAIDYVAGKSGMLGRIALADHTACNLQRPAKPGTRSAAAQSHADVVPEDPGGVCRRATAGRCW